MSFIFYFKNLKSSKKKNTFQKTFFGLLLATYVRQSVIDRLAAKVKEIEKQLE